MVYLSEEDVGTVIGWLWDMSPPDVTMHTAGIYLCKQTTRKTRYAVFGNMKGPEHCSKLSQIVVPEQVV